MPLHKLVNNKYYNYNIYFKSPPPNKSFGYFSQNFSAESEYIPENFAVSLSHVLPELVRIVPSEDDRPDNIMVPKDKHLSFPVFHQGEIKYIKLKVKFSLNTNYDPKAGKKSFDGGVKACNGWMNKHYK